MFLILLMHGANMKIRICLTEGGGCEWFYLAKTRVQCRILMNTVMNMRIPQKIAVS